MKDYLIKATVPGVRAFCTVTTESVAEAVTRHDCYPIAAAALGRTMTASSAGIAMTSTSRISSTS